jgi:DNA helicase-2/ATP-dependent DNA helicase PcrA
MSRSDPAPARLTDPDQLRALMAIPFSDQQLAAATAPPTPGVIVAGAGSGKTTVMAARVVWLVGTGTVRADQVLGLTFTNKAAAELGHRVREALNRSGLRDRGAAGEDQLEPLVATYHAFAGRLICEHGLRLGVEPATRLLADASRFQLAGLACERHRGVLAHVSTDLPTTLASVLKLDAEMSEHLVSPAAVHAVDAEIRKELNAVDKPSRLVERALATTLKRDELVELVEAYRALKLDRGVMDFADQMAIGARLAQECPEVGRSERERFLVVLLDEYQDTSVAQRLMLSGLFSGDVDAPGRGHPVTAVGDPCQGIYGWRGASVANLDDFPDHFRKADGTPAPSYPLSVNRRSRSSILEVANVHAGELYSVHRGVRPLSAAPGAGAGTVRAALFERYDEQLSWVADQIAAVPRDHPGVAWSGVGVLVHRMGDARALQLELRRREVPVEVVGLGGLLSRPEVADVVATLEVVHDLTANAALLRLLTGPRWRIGTRDLALLGARARSIARVEPARNPPGAGADAVAVALEQAVTGFDPIEIVSLADALDDPGTAGYSAQALERFAALSGELNWLRRFTGEPLVDLVRRVIETIGLDVELASGTGAVAAQARDNLAAFVDAVASFAGTEGDASLQSLLAYLKAEESYAQGLPVASPTESNSVKLLTVHKAKGLEWDVVFVPELTETVFPSSLTRPRWPTNAEALPGRLRGDAATLPEVGEWTTKGERDFKAASAAHEGLEERRLGYVAFTRARRALVLSGCWWGPTQKRRRGPSEYLRQARRLVEQTWDGSAARHDPWAPEPEETENPHLAESRSAAWPAPLDREALRSRAEAARLVEEARVRHRETGSYDPDDELLLDQAATVAEWDHTIARLVEEARTARRAEHLVELPQTLSATALLELRTDPDGLAHRLARPMPRRPSAAARFGTRFHAWVEAFVGQQQLLDPGDIPGAADEGIDGAGELARLCRAFAAGPFGERVPHRVEAPFALAIGGQVVRGRIDAVYLDDEGFHVIDWKTSREQAADPLPLAIYRLAWAELTGTPVERVRASFYYVRTGELVTPAGLPGRDEPR